jgi:predicted RNA-binding Zn ribbon-like protein
MIATPESIHLWGETLCLNYANTVDWSPTDEHVTPEQTDVLRTSESLGRWGKRLGLYDPADAPPIAESELGQARTIRDAIYRVFAAISREQPPSRQDLRLLGDQYAEAVAEAELVEGQAGFSLEWRAKDPRRVRFAVAADAFSLLCDPSRLPRVTRCPGRGCGWLFLNTSGRRRWCSMTTCGSREKMRRLHERQRQF